MTQKDEALRMAIATFEDLRNSFGITGLETTIATLKAALSEPEQVDINPCDGHYQLVTIGEPETVTLPDGWVADPDTIPSQLIEIARQAICLELYKGLIMSNHQWIKTNRPFWWVINPWLYIKRRDKAYADALDIIEELSK